MVLIKLPDILCGSNYFGWQNRLAAQTCSLLLIRVQQKTLLLSSEKLSSLYHRLYPFIPLQSLHKGKKMLLQYFSISDSLTVQNSLSDESSLMLFKMTVSSKNWTEQAGNTFSLLCSSWRYSTRRVYILYICTLSLIHS